MKEKHFEVLMRFIDRCVVPPFARLGNFVWFYSTRAALQQIAPVAVAGSLPVFILLFMRNVLGVANPAAEALLKTLFDVSFGLVGILFTACMAFEMGEKRKDVKRVHCLIAGVVAYLAVAAGKGGFSGIAARLGPEGILVSILTTLGAVQLLALVAKLNLADGLGKHIPMGVAAEVSDIVSVLAVALAFWGLVQVLPFDLYEMMQKGTGGLLWGFDTWPCLLILMLLLQLLWFSGMHGGSAIVWGIMSPFMLMLLYQNALQVFAGGAPTGIVTQPFLFTFAMPTGVGITLPLAFIWRKSKQETLRDMSRVSVKPGLFNINETVVFGTPILRNRFFFVPFVLLTPAMGSLFGYFLTKAGWIGAAAVQVPWPTPILLQPLLATGLDWRGAAAQLVLLLAVALVWLPFAKRWEAHLRAEQGARQGDEQKEPQKSQD